MAVGCKQPWNRIKKNPTKLLCMQFRNHTQTHTVTYTQSHTHTHKHSQVCTHMHTHTQTHTLSFTKHHPCSSPKLFTFFPRCLAVTFLKIILGLLSVAQPTRQLQDPKQKMTTPSATCTLSCPLLSLLWCHTTEMSVTVTLLLYISLPSSLTWWGGVSLSWYSLGLARRWCRFDSPVR